MIHWQPVDAPPPLDANALHVWRLPAEAPPDARDWLDAAEQARLASLTQPGAAARFLATRAGLRRILAGYLGCQPAAVELRIADGGKPALTDGPCFNLSHTGDLALLAVATFPVGIDVERRRPMPRAAAIAKRVLDAVTVAQLEQRQGDARDRIFLQAWTAMEARQKCVGEGVFGRRVSAAEVGNLSFEPDAGHLAHLCWQHPTRIPEHFWLATMS